MTGLLVLLVLAASGAPVFFYRLGRKRGGIRGVIVARAEVLSFLDAEVTMHQRKGQREKAALVSRLRSIFLKRWSARPASPAVPLAAETPPGGEGAVSLVVVSGP